MPSSISDSTLALRRLRNYFMERPTRAGILARAALGIPRDDESSLRATLLGRIRAHIRIDGTIGGATLPSIWGAAQLLDLGARLTEGPSRRLLESLLALQNHPGAYHEGCTVARHAHHACEHYLSGFFAPAPTSHRVTPLTLPTGKTFRAEPAGRFAVSCFALAVALRAGQLARPLVAQHVASLIRLNSEWVDWGGYYAPDLAFCALAALARLPEPDNHAAESLVAVIRANQRVDGTWPSTDLFHALEALALVQSPLRETLLRRGLPALLSHQRPDGGFGRMAGEERSWIAVRVLLAVGEGGRKLP